MSVRVEICGGIASGKTTLAQIFEEQAVFEQFRKVPYWKKFYADPERYCFETELAFLAQHYHLVKESIDACTYTIFDFSLIQDAAYADVNLRSGRLRSFLEVYREMSRELGESYILVHLICDEEELLKRIRRRGRGAEGKISIEYIRNINAALEARVKAVDNLTHVVKIDSKANNFYQDPVIRNSIREYILELIKVR